MFTAGMTAQPATVMTTLHGVGDFKGLGEKLDYIKALGFSAIWVTPVVTNGSGYDYHGYHAMDLSTVDARYESSDYTYEDLIHDAHTRRA